MKILSNEEYRTMIVREKCLVECIDYALKQLGMMDGRDIVQMSNDSRYYFWDAIGHLKGSMHYYKDDAKYKDELIKPEA